MNNGNGEEKLVCCSWLLVARQPGSQSEAARGRIRDGFSSLIYSDKRTRGATRRSHLRLFWSWLDCYLVKVIVLLSWLSWLTNVVNLVSLVEALSVVSLVSLVTSVTLVNVVS